MAIRCNLSTLMGQNRYSIKDVSEKTEINRNSISNLYYDRVKQIDYDTLDKLCKLFKCASGDIIEFVEDEVKQETK